MTSSARSPKPHQHFLPEAHTSFHIYTTIERADFVDFWTRMRRCVSSSLFVSLCSFPCRTLTHFACTWTMVLGPFAGLIYTTILIVNFLLFSLSRAVDAVTGNEFRPRPLETGRVSRLCARCSVPTSLIKRLGLSGMNELIRPSSPPHRPDRKRVLQPTSPPCPA
ncbi:hypothetical protein OG21DRAFT_1307027 [Imleria badia]|nr:hypothetical protein OG21DRAFT_1307027 [Imleria badia]